MGNEISELCNCKEINDAFNPNLEDVNSIYLIIIFIKIELSKKSK